MTEGRTYSFRFKARASAAVSPAISVGGGAAPYTMYFGRTVGPLVPAGTLYNCAPVTVKLGPPDAPVFGCALSPGLAGLYQVAIQVPSSLPDGDYPLKVTVGGASSPDGVVLSVKQ